MQRHKRPEPWQEDLVLDDGRRLWLRPIEPADAAPLRGGFALLEPDEVRMRFMHPMTELSEAMADRLARIDTRSEFALVAAEPLPPGEALIGAVARCSVDTTGRAEFAILVSRLLSGQGLGRLMMRRIIDWARRKRVDSIYGLVLRENFPMLELAHELGFHRETLPDEPGVVKVWRRPGSPQGDSTEAERG